MILNWKRKDIIQLNLPKWDKYNERNSSKYNLSNLIYNNKYLCPSFIKILKLFH